MEIPKKIPGLRPLTIITALYGVIWISLEGDLGRVLALAFAVTAVGLGHLLQRALGGRRLPRRWWLAISASLGQLFGMGGGILTLVFMALKTGLHSHGPEFSPTELDWVVQQIVLWGGAGLLAGLGAGLLTGEE